MSSWGEWFDPQRAFTTGSHGSCQDKLHSLKNAFIRLKCCQPLSAVMFKWWLLVDQINRKDSVKSFVPKKLSPFDFST